MPAVDLSFKIKADHCMSCLMPLEKDDVFIPMSLFWELLVTSCLRLQHCPANPRSPTCVAHMLLDACFNWENITHVLLQHYSIVHLRGKA